MRPQIEFVRPCGRMLSHNFEIGLRDAVGIDPHGLGVPKSLLRLRFVDQAIDQDVRDMILGPTRARDCARPRNANGRGEGGKIRPRAQAGGRAGEDDGAVAAGSHRRQDSFATVSPSATRQRARNHQARVIAVRSRANVHCGRTPRRDPYRVPRPPRLSRLSDVAGPVRVKPPCPTSRPIALMRLLRDRPRMSCPEAARAREARAEPVRDPGDEQKWARAGHVIHSQRRMLAMITSCALHPTKKASVRATGIPAV